MILCTYIVDRGQFKQQGDMVMVVQLSEGRALERFPPSVRPLCLCAPPSTNRVFHYHKVACNIRYTLGSCFKYFQECTYSTRQYLPLTTTTTQEPQRLVIVNRSVSCRGWLTDQIARAGKQRLKIDLEQVKCRTDTLNARLVVGLSAC